MKVFVVSLKVFVVILNQIDVFIRCCRDVGTRLVAPLHALVVSMKVFVVVLNQIDVCIQCCRDVVMGHGMPRPITHYFVADTVSDNTSIKVSKR
jgi:hypothetical protein